MRHSLKIQLASFVAILFIGISGLQAQDVTTVEATSQEISNHLDLEAVASIFGDSKDLEDFENRLNDPETQISNLDLNNDNYVDYLRVVEIVEENTHVIVIQAVLGDDIFQDVATIEVEKDNEGTTRVQVVGDVYMYGDNYIIEPVYVHRPIFFSNFWRPHYRPYCSNWYWGYYPRYYYHWSPYHVDYYHTHIYYHINVHHTYHYTNVRRSRRAVHIHNTHRRNDYGRRHVDRSYSSRRQAGHRAVTRGSTKSRRDAAVARGTTYSRSATKRAGRVSVDKSRRSVAPSTKIKKGRRVSATSKSRTNKSSVRKPMKVTKRGNKFGIKPAARKGNKKATDVRKPVNTRTREVSTKRPVTSRKTTTNKRSTSVRKPTSTNSRKVFTKRPASTRKATKPTTSRKTYAKPRATKRSSSNTVSKRSPSRKSSTSSRPKSSSRKSASTRSGSARSSKSSGSASRGSSSRGRKR